MPEDLIITEEYARQSHTDIQFINQLNDCGLIEITVFEQVSYLSPQQLPLLEKYTRLHYDLDINLAGLEAISHLLQRIEEMRGEVENLRRALRLYGHE